MKLIRLYRTTLFWMTLAAVTPAASFAGIELCAPENGAAISLIRADWREQISLRGKENKVIKIERRMDFPEKINFSFQCGTNNRAVLEIALDPEFSRIVRREKSDGKNLIRVANLELGRKYFWQVRCGKQKSTVRSFTTVADIPRFIAVPGSRPGNFRDLGGKSTLDGRMTCQNKIFRGTEMHNRFSITDAGKKFMLGELKIKSDLDFRYPAQTAKYSRSALGEAVNWVKIPINAYKSFTPEQNDFFRDAIRFFAVKENYPVYMHCSGGVDRTGEIAYLLNMILNVDEESALLDYEASSLCIFPRQRTIQYFNEWRKQIAAFSPAGTSPQMQVANYLKNIGVSESDMNAIRKIMTE